MLFIKRKPNMSVYFTPTVTFLLLLTCRTFCSNFAREIDSKLNSALNGSLLQKLNTSVFGNTVTISLNTNKSFIDLDENTPNQRQTFNNHDTSDGRVVHTQDVLFSNAHGDISKMTDEELVNHEIRDINKHSNSESNLETTILSQLTKLFRERAKQFKYRMQTFLTGELDNKSSKKSDVSSTPIRPLSESTSILRDTDSVETETSDKFPRQKTARQFQFVFHPYMPYGKEVMPDEKLSIHDVLPVKMVKFIKSMVEDAPWEAMFMKMVRMVVDQFVDKIMEKMFAGKDEEDKWRSADGPFELNPSVLSTSTHIERMRRSADISKVSKDGQTGNGLPSMNQLNKDAGELENDNWLDLFLDYVFPGEDKEDQKANDKLPLTSRRKRDVDHIEEKEDVVNSPPLLDTDLFDGMQNFVLTLKARQALKDFIKYRILKRVLRPLTSWREITDTKRIDLNTHPNYLISSHRNKHVPVFIGENPANANFVPLIRHKRSGRGNSRRIDDETNDLYQNNKKQTIKKEGDHSERLWQSNHGVRSSHFKRDDCSLRRACNAGRLLARLPSVEDITLQLKSHHHEPHWDALLWGLKKRRCSKIFCKRQRSPKGSKNIWIPSESRQNRKVRLTTPAFDRDEDDESTTIIPF